MTVHSGICGPVHTGILSGIELFGALRLQRRLEPCSTTSATGPSRCVPPPCGTTAPPKSGAYPSPTFCVPLLTPQVVPTLGFDRRPGLFQAPPSSWTTSSTLPRRVRLLGLSGGRWAATDGRAETTVTKGYSFFVEVLIVYWHFHGSHGARFYILLKSVVTSSGKEGGKHSGSASAR